MPNPRKLDAGNKNDVIAVMQNTLDGLKANDPKAMEALAASAAPGNQNENRARAIAALSKSIDFVKSEEQPQGQPFHSRDPIAGTIQSYIESRTLPELQAFAEGNPVVWIPAGIKGIFEHFKGKYPFKTATKASDVIIKNQCKIALFGDWGADNDHARNIAKQAMSHNPDYIIHLGDIYYSGSESECQTFLKNWPLKDAAGNSIKGRSFALNGNHEMYSLGRPYFTTVLDAFGQEASYFTLSNDYWQLHGLDSAYLPFSIGAGDADDRLKVQWNWLRERMAIPNKKNIFLSHNQPVSAHLPEFEAAQALMDEARILLADFGSQSIFGWFFGHEHRCAIYNDKALSARFRARLIGNGAIGHHPQTETAPAKDETGAEAHPFVWVNRRSLEDKGVVAMSSFALLNLDGDKIHIDYIDEDGIVGYNEDWTVHSHF
jgi:predicted phosphodiesterase